METWSQVRRGRSRYRRRYRAVHFCTFSLHQVSKFLKVSGEAGLSLPTSVTYRAVHNFCTFRLQKIVRIFFFYDGQCRVRSGTALCTDVGTYRAMNNFCTFSPRKSVKFFARSLRSLTIHNYHLIIRW